jgi:exosortase/archaeosortase family protein
MPNQYYSQFKTFVKEKKLEPIVDVVLFISITLIIHYTYRYWVTTGYFPIKDLMSAMHDHLSHRVFVESNWFLQNVLGMEITTVDRTMYWADQGYIAINHGCSGLKQMIQFALLMAIFPGPWKHKLWYIPLGVFIVHLTNLFRIIGLGVVLVTVPDYWQFSHDYIFRPFFYVVIFSLWVYWVEKLKNK